MPPTKLTRPQWRLVFELSPVISKANYFGDLYPSRKWDWPEGWLTKKLQAKAGRKSPEVEGR